MNSDNNGLQTKPAISRFDLRRVNRSGSLKPGVEPRRLRRTCVCVIPIDLSALLARRVRDEDSGAVGAGV